MTTDISGNVTQFLTDGESVVTIATSNLNDDASTREDDHEAALAAVREKLDVQDEY